MDERTMAQILADQLRTGRPGIYDGPADAQTLRALTDGMYMYPPPVQLPRRQPGWEKAVLTPPGIPTSNELSLIPGYGDSRARAAENAPSLANAPKAMADMLAATLRGGVSQALGMPGDIESLGRMGINWLGNKVGAGELVNPESALPNTQDFSKKHLPPLNPMVPIKGGEHPMEVIGQFAPVPGAIEGGLKAAQLVKALRSAPRAAEPIIDTSRRDFLKQAGSTAAVGAIGASTPKLLSDALRAVPGKVSHTTSETTKVAKDAKVTPKTASEATKVARVTADQLDDMMGRWDANTGVSIREYLDHPEDVANKISDLVGDVPHSVLEERLHHAADVIAEAVSTGHVKRIDGYEMPFREAMENAARDALQGKKLELIDAPATHAPVYGPLDTEDRHFVLKLLGYN